jgi:glycosyltransferase involved in cell wall biosynthesis
MIPTQTAPSTSAEPNVRQTAFGVSLEDQSIPWVLVAEDFCWRSGMGRANLALSRYLIARGTPVHLVGHSIDSELAKHPLAIVHPVPRPAGSNFLGGPLLDLCGRRIVHEITRRWPNARVLVNGSNCLWPGINWVHYVHRASNAGSQGPAWFRAKQRWSTLRECRREFSAARLARIFIANSQKTSRDLTELVGVDSQKIRMVYPGTESDWEVVTARERAAARRSFKISETGLLAAFVGALGFDNNKGFDIVLKAWRLLCTDPRWEVDLLVAGGGRALAVWQRRLVDWGLKDRIRFLGFTDRIRDVLAAVDVLVSPVRYESYGLNVQEAICRGIPAIVSSGAGIAERYGPELAPLLLSNPEDVNSLIDSLWLWRSNRKNWQVGFQRFGDSLRRYGWNDMAARIVSIATEVYAP